jgi:signal transduction histidine kinase
MLASLGRVAYRLGGATLPSRRTEAGATDRTALVADTAGSRERAFERPSTAVPHPIAERDESREALAILAEEQTALRRVATLVAQGAAPGAVFAAVAEEAGRLLGADIAAIDRFDADDMVTLVAVHGITHGAPAIGSQTPVAATGNAARVRATGRPSRIDHYTKQISPLGFQSGFRAAVSAPITVGGHLWGAMTVASTREDEPFPRGTEARLEEFTELAATAIANAQAREELRAVADEQAALRRVAMLVAHGAPPEAVFSAVAEELALLVGADAANVVRYESDGTATAVGGWSAHRLEIATGTRMTMAAAGVAMTVLRRGTTTRTEHFDGPSGSVGGHFRAAGLRSGVGSPILVQDQLWGVEIVASAAPDPLPAGSDRRLEAFTELVATAIGNADGRAQLVAARRRVIEATDSARAKLARDIHDGAQQQFLTALIDLQLAQQKRSSDPGRSRELVDLAAAQVETGVETLRELAAGVHPAVLSDMGLRAALEALAARMPLPLSVEVDDLELPAAVEASVYFFCSEALTNVVKHAKASAASVKAEAVDGQLRVEVCDDGIGGAETDSCGTGLIGLRDRIRALDGSLSVSSPPGGTGTTLVARIPLPS